MAMAMHIREADMLQQLKMYFGVGRVKMLPNSNRADYYVPSSGIPVLLTHFILYPIQTKKWLMFTLFVHIDHLMKTQELHRSLSGFTYLVGLINKLNKPIKPTTLDRIRHLVPQVPDIDISTLGLLERPAVTVLNC